MLLRLTDGNEMVTLSGDGAAILGCAYVPRPPSSIAGRVADDATVIVEGTTAQIVTVTQAMERLFAIARSAPSHNYRLWIEFQRDSDTVVWRSQVHDGRLLWSDDPMQRRLASGVSAVSVVAAWERDDWWETATETDAGTIHIMNGDGSIDEVGMWIGPGGPVTYDGSVAIGEGNNARNAGKWAAIDGVLPTPAHLTITNESGGAITMRRALVANDIYAEFNGTEHLIQSGAAVSWTGASAHGTARWSLAMSATQITKGQSAGGLRLLGVFTAADAGLYLRATLYHVSTGPVLTEAWRGPEVLTIATRKVYDLGVVALPPDVDATFEDLYLIISIYATATGGATLDFVQLCPGTEMVTLEGAVLSWANAAALAWYGDRRYSQMNDYHASIAASGRLMLQPARTNRIMVLVEGSSGVDSTAELKINVKYRPRRATL